MCLLWNASKVGDYNSETNLRWRGPFRLRLFTSAGVTAYIMGNSNEAKGG
jgi:hypothetical protein